MELKQYSDEELSKMGYKKLGRLLCMGYTGDMFKTIMFYYDKAREDNRY